MNKSKNPPKNEQGQCPKFKRLTEWFSADSDFRDRFLKNPGAALEEKQLNLDPVAALEATQIQYNLTPVSGNYLDNPYFRGTAAWVSRIHALLVSRTTPEKFASQNLYQWNQNVRNRLLMENRQLRRHSNIFYFPITFELGDGCTVQCPFCGVDAGKWKANFSYTEENRKLWKEVLEISRRVIGQVAGTGSCYYATEPFDNPDYERFLQDFHDVMGIYPQTTTSVADRDPERIRRFLHMLGDELSCAAVRFSVRSLKQFYRIMDLYSAEELEHVEIITNNLESINSYSLSGRARKYAGKLPEEKRNARYSISCVAGFRVNMATQTIVFMEPEIPDETFPTGTRAYEVCHFRDGEEYAAQLYRLLDLYAVPLLLKDRILRWNPYIRIQEQPGQLLFLGDGIGMRMKPNQFLCKSTALISDEAFTYEQLVSELGIFGFSETLLWEELNRLYQKGYLRLK